MAEHKVTFAVPNRQLGKADLEFHMRRNGVKFGTLLVSNGSLVWYPRNAWRVKDKHGIKVTWKQFDAILAKWQST